jgi:hypothetical protein
VCVCARAHACVCLVVLHRPHKRKRKVKKKKPMIGQGPPALARRCCNHQHDQHDQQPQTTPPRRKQTRVTRAIIAYTQDHRATSLHDMHHHINIIKNDMHDLTT